jgi:hypothetical protein
MHVNITEQNSCYKNSWCDGICSWDAMAFTIVPRIRLLIAHVNALIFVGFEEIHS